MKPTCIWTVNLLDNCFMEGFGLFWQVTVKRFLTCRGGLPVWSASPVFYTLQGSEPGLLQMVQCIQDLISFFFQQVCKRPLLLYNCALRACCHGLFWQSAEVWRAALTILNVSSIVFRKFAMYSCLSGGASGLGYGYRISWGRLNFLPNIKKFGL